MTDKEFNNRMEGIDKVLRQVNMPIFRRPFNAIHEYSVKYKTSLIIGGKSLYDSKDKYDEVNLAYAISQWYDKRYGDKVKVNYSRGKVALMLKGDVFKLVIPMVFGKAVVGFNNKNDFSNIPIEDGTMLLNVISFVEGLTDELISTISFEEGDEIIKIYGIASELFNLLEREKNQNELCELAKIDFNLAVDSLFQNETGIGHSKWSSLQAVEKITKSVLNYYTIPYTKTHDLGKLLNKLKNICFANIDESLIKTIQCSASIRYERGNYNISDAVKAHHYSLYLSKELLKCCV